MVKLQRKTPRLIVRPLQSKDYAFWKKAHLEMEKSKNTWDSGPRLPEALTRKDFAKMLKGQAERRRQDTFYDLGVFTKSGSLVGNVSIMEISRGISQTAYLGYRIFNNYWGQGYAKEAVGSMIEIGFKELRLHRIEAGIEPGNKRSIRLAKSLKMRKEGLKKRALYLRNTWVDLLMFTLTSEDMGHEYNSKNLSWKARS